MNQSTSERSPRPEEFPLGSAESRAAARAMQELRERGIARLQIIFDIFDTPSHANLVPEVGPWYESNGTLTRILFIPPGTDEETQRRLLATP